MILPELYQRKYDEISKFHSSCSLLREKDLEGLILHTLFMLLVKIQTRI